MTATRTGTSVSSYTTTITSSDVRQVMRLVTTDIQAVCRAASHVACSFDLDAALIDASLLVLNGVASGISLSIHLNNVVIREYAFEFGDSRTGASGPPAGQPPLGYVPPEARIRLSVRPDMRTPEPERRAWFDRLGWKDAVPLTYGAGTTTAAYGSFQSGGLCVQRHLKTNPKYDRPV